MNFARNKPLHHIFSEDQTISPVVKELAKHSAMSVDLALVRNHLLLILLTKLLFPAKQPPIVHLRPFLLVAPLILLLAESLTAISETISHGDCC